MLKVEQVIQRVLGQYRGLVQNTNWGERGLFYNPGNVLPKGKYMLTFKEKDGKNDSSSNLNRNDIYRLNLKISKDTFIKKFDSVPSRPPAGGTIGLQDAFKKYDFTELDKVMPHPVYGWMTWICVLSPTEKTIAAMEDAGYFDEAYTAAMTNFDKDFKKTSVGRAKCTPKKLETRVSKQSVFIPKTSSKKPNARTFSETGFDDLNKCEPKRNK